MEMLGTVNTPKATLFHWNFLYGQVMAVFGLESGCIEICWYPNLMTSIIKYLLPLVKTRCEPFLQFQLKLSYPLILLESFVL